MSKMPVQFTEQADWPKLKKCLIFAIPDEAVYADVVHQIEGLFTRSHLSPQAAEGEIPERIWVHQGKVYRINPDNADMDTAPVEYIRATSQAAEVDHQGVWDEAIRIVREMGQQWRDGVNAYPRIVNRSEWATKVITANEVTKALEAAKAASLASQKE